MATLKHIGSLSSVLLLSSVCLLLLMLSIGPKLPYLQTDFSFRFRMYYLCPVLTGLILYKGFIYRKRGHKTASVQTYFKSLKSWGEKIKSAFMLLGGDSFWASTFDRYYRVSCLRDNAFCNQTVCAFIYDIQD